jgi:hypothetical protein
MDQGDPSRREPISALSHDTKHRLQRQTCSAVRLFMWGTQLGRIVGRRHRCRNIPRIEPTPWHVPLISICLVDEHVCHMYLHVLARMNLQRFAQTMAGEWQGDRALLPLARPKSDTRVPRAYTVSAVFGLERQRKGRRGRWRLVDTASIAALSITPIAITPIGRVNRREARPAFV